VKEPAQLPKFDAGNWVKLARLAVAASMALSAATVAMLLTTDPPNQCPDWHLKNAHSTSLWEDVLVLTVPLNIFGCFIAVRWNWVARRAMESGGRQVRTLFGHMTPTIPVAYVLVNMCVMNSLVSQFPLYLLVTQCIVR
jgi:hypothetical protein